MSRNSHGFMMRFPRKPGLSCLQSDDRWSGCLFIHVHPFYLLVLQHCGAAGMVKYASALAATGGAVATQRTWAWLGS